MAEPDAVARLETHLTVIGVLFLVSGGMGILMGIFLFFMLAGIGAGVGEPEAFAVLGSMGFLIGALIILFAIPSIVGGIGLIQRRSWSRILGIVLGGLHLLSIPFGTALGIYTLWALTRPEAAHILAPRA